MLFKYVVSGTPGTKEDYRQDIAKLLSGELLVSNLSANCDQALSGFVAGESKPSTYFTIEVNDGTDSILKRVHSDAPSITTWLDVRANSNTAHVLASMSDGTGGVRTNPSSQYDSASTAYTGLQQDCTAIGKTFYIGLTDTLAFMCRENASYGVIWMEAHEMFSDTEHHSYTAPKAAGLAWTRTIAGTTPNVLYSSTIRGYGSAPDTIVANSLVTFEICTFSDTSEQVQSFDATGQSIPGGGLGYMVELLRLRQAAFMAGPTTQHPDVYLMRGTNNKTSIRGMLFTDTGGLGNLLALSVTDSNDGEAWETLFIKGI